MIDKRVLDSDAGDRHIQRAQNQPLIDLLNEWAGEAGDPHNDAEVWDRVKAKLLGERAEEEEQPMSAQRILVRPTEQDRRAAQRIKNQPMIDRVNDWLASDSDEDEEVFQRLKEVLEANHTPARKLFHDE